MKKIEEIIRNTTEEEQEKVDWTKAWSTKYPVLATYQKEVDIPKYAAEIRRMFTELQEDYNYSELDAELFEDTFYGKKETDPQMHKKKPENTMKVPEGVDAELLAKVLSNSEMTALLTSLAKTLK